MIRVAIDDLAFLPVDAVLRAADDQLDPASPDSSVLDRQGGDSLLAARRVQDRLEVGSAVVTASGDLAAPFVIHVVVRAAEGAVTTASVERALTAAWYRARDWQLARLAAPLVGLGPGQLDPEAAAEAIARTLRAARAEHGFPHELTVVVRDERERGLVAPVLEKPAP
ncbi:MAG: macro domain-containing protein [Gemmatimonadota bacterium]